jgi:hypothetical protein
MSGTLILVLIGMAAAVTWIGSTLRSVRCDQLHRSELDLSALSRLKTRFEAWQTDPAGRDLEISAKELAFVLSELDGLPSEVSFDGSNASLRICLGGENGYVTQYQGPLASKGGALLLKPTRIGLGALDLSPVLAGVQWTVPAGWLGGEKLPEAVARFSQLNLRDGRLFVRMHPPEARPERARVRRGPPEPRAPAPEAVATHPGDPSAPPAAPAPAPAPAPADQGEPAAPPAGDAQPNLPSPTPSVSPDGARQTPTELPPGGAGAASPEAP